MGVPLPPPEPEPEKFGVPNRLQMTYPDSRSTKLFLIPQVGDTEGVVDQKRKSLRQQCPRL